MLGLSLVVLALPMAAPAAQTPRPGPADPRIRVVAYNPMDVVAIHGFYGFSQMIEFGSDEVIQAVSIGDSLAWQVTPTEQANRLFLKPVEPDAHTNLTVVTNQHAYNFELIAREAEEVPEMMTYTVRFRYPGEQAARLQARLREAERRQDVEVTPAAAVPPSQWNLDYSYQGPEQLAPRHTFDNGRFTYFQFREQQEVPAIFLVAPDGKESLVNWHRRGKYIVVERTGRQFTLRFANDRTVCVFNMDDPPPRAADVAESTAMDEKRRGGGSGLDG